MGRNAFMDMKKSFYSGVKTILVTGILVAAPSMAKVEYHLNKVDNPSADEQDAYKRIAAAMDSAVYIYNTYTHLSKHIEVHYNTGVQTADASYNGTMRFGSGRAYMNVRTALHEMGHTMGMGTTTEYRNMLKDGVFQGPIAQAKVKELTGDPTTVLKGDSQHFWPYGLNYDSEMKSEQDLINHALMVEAMYQDIFKEAFYKEARIQSMTDEKCMGITSSNGLELMDCSAPATITKIWSVGENPTTYRIEFGDRVLDIPNESTAAGVVASTYYWNAGTHQKYVFESAPVNMQNAFYLQNYKSKLYLLPDGKNIVQDQRSRDIQSGVWILKDVSAEPPADTSTVNPPADTSMVDTSATDSSQAIYRNLDRAKAQILQVNPRKFDAKGRAYGETRQKPKYFKLF